MSACGFMGCDEAPLAAPNLAESNLNLPIIYGAQEKWLSLD